MKNKIFSFLLAFTVLTLASGAIYCDCAFAEVAKPPTIEKQGMMDCHGEATAAGNSSKKDCCGNCALDELTVNSGAVQATPNRAHENLNLSDLLVSTIRMITHPLHLKVPLRNHSLQSFSERPLYLTLQTLLI